MGVFPVNRMRLVSGVSATAAIAAAALAGCSSGGSGTTSASGGSSPAPAASDAAGTAPAGTGGGTGTSSGGGPSAGSGTTSSGNQCTTSDLSLRVLQGPQDESSTTGSMYAELTNVSSRACTLYGFPGVELIGGIGRTPKPLDMKDHWTAKLSNGGKKVQTLAPHTASAAFITFSTRVPGASAGIPRAQVVQVIPPNQRKALTAKIYNVDAGYVTPLITSKTLNVGPMGADTVPHK